MAKVYVCRGSDCRKHSDDYDALLSTCAQGTKIKTVRCQKICKGAVVGTEVNGRIEWFAKMHKTRPVQAFVRLIETGRMAGSLAKRRVAKRAGKLR